MKKAAVGALLFLSCNAGQMDNLDDDGQPMPPRKDGPVAQQRRELKGGARLKAKWIKGEDGSEIAAGLFDTKLNADCTFDEAEDGKTRCLPTSTAAHYWPNFAGFSVGIYLFIDGACTQRAAASSLCSPPVKYARFTDTCGSRTRIATLTEVTVPRLYYRTTAGTCSGTIDPAQQQLRAYSFGQTLPPSDFALGEVSVE